TPARSAPLAAPFPRAACRAGTARRPAGGRAVETTRRPRRRRAPTRAGRGPVRVDQRIRPTVRSAVDLAGLVVDVLDLVVLVVLVDADGGLGRVTRRVELDRPAHAVVVEVLALVEQLLAGLEVVALLAAGADLLELGRDVRRGVALGELGRERDQVRRVIGLGTVVPVLELGVDLEHPLPELLGSGRTGLGALGALHRALGEAVGAGAVVREVTVDEVPLDLVGGEALLHQLGYDLLGLVEADEGDRLGVRRLDLGDVGGVLGRLRVVDHLLDHLAATGLDRLLRVVGETRAIGVLEGEDADGVVAVGEDQVTEDTALPDVRRRGRASCRETVWVWGEDR